MRSVYFLFAAGLSVIASSAAYSWEFKLTEGDRAGTITACLAVQEYSNAWFAARVYDDKMDFIYHRDDFTLPYDAALGLTALEFPDLDSTFYLLAYTMSRTPSDYQETSSTIYFMAKPEYYASMFDAMRNGKTMMVIFPNGDAYKFSLTGSARTLNMVSDCWKRIPTGPVHNNPFEKKPDNNPFVAPEDSQEPPQESQDSTEKKQI